MSTPVLEQGLLGHAGLNSHDISLCSSGRGDVLRIEGSRPFAFDWLRKPRP